MKVTLTLQDYLWRPLTDSEEDTAFILSMRNAPAARGMFYTTHLTRDEHLRFLRLTEERDDINWIIERDGQRLGASGIFRIDRKNRRAEGGRVVVSLPELYLLNLVVMHYVVFEYLGMNKSCGETLITNAVVNRALERLGVVKEGVLRQHAIVNGEARDVVIYGTLASEWAKVKPGIIAQFGEVHLIRHRDN